MYGTGKRASTSRLRRRARSRGFTLVELLLVLVILALIGGLVLPGIIGKAEGARIAAQGDLPADDRLAQGHFVPPTLFVDVTKDMRIAQEEIFGPVTCVMKFSTEAEAVDIANSTDFALVAAVYSQSIETCNRMARAIEAGIVFLNNYNRIVLGTPFGGTKSSGYGREHCADTLKEFSYPKAIRVPTGRTPIPEWATVTELFKS